MHQAVPPEFNPKEYRSLNADLADLRKAALRKHWRQHGIHQNRNASGITSRETLMRECLSHCNSLLEIGPFDRPSLEAFRKSCKTIEYADYLDTTELKVRATQLPLRKPEMVPSITYVLAKGFPEIDKRFDAVVSHHCIEHQPDLIQHIHDVLGILNPQGFYLFTAPHKSLCFDHFIPESTYLEAIVAYVEKRKKPCLRSVLETRCFARHEFKEAPNPFAIATPEMRRQIESAHNEFTNSAYVDVHCWQFTPASIKTMILNLSILGYIPEVEIRVFCLGPEFGCVLARKSVK